MLGIATATSKPAATSRASADTSLQVLQQQNQQLREALSKLPWPPLVSFKLNGKTYTLPVTSRTHLGGTHLFKIAPQELEYLAGFFDGDGCVRRTQHSCSLLIGQSVDGVAVLMRMHSAFGGSIHRARDGVGLHRPTLLWVLHGSSARIAASLLAPHSIVKRRQLELVWDWPSVLAGKVDGFRTLDLLKRSDSGVAAPCTWAYFAGFFDAEGYIAQQGAKPAFSLRVTQKYRTVLVCLRKFLATEMSIEASIYHGYQNRSYDLAINKTQNCKDVLQRLLSSGLLRKAAEAKLAVDLTKENAEQVREAMAQMVGNQGFVRRLDSAGLQRAKSIVNARARAKRAADRGQSSLAEAILAEVDHQKYEHARLHARTLNEQLHAYISKVRGMHDESGHGCLQAATHPSICAPDN